MTLNRDGEAPPYVRLNASLDDRILGLEKKVAILEERLRSLTKDGFQEPQNPQAIHPLSKRQAAYIMDICKELGWSIPLDMEQWSADKASNWLEEHINEFKLHMAQKRKLAIA